ncbi:MAG: glycosyltransferase [Candidatus Omnitrophica bacterium]|nr:glycosyltransferase [Candidatus Omnitrophota bacterium]
MNEPLVSIIIPVKNARNTIGGCLVSVLNLDYGNFEVIVVDDGSQDKTGEIIQSFSGRVKLITHPQSRGPSSARNEAAGQAKGEFLAFTDADCIVDKDWLKELLSGFTESNIASVGGRQEVPEDETVFGRRVFKFMKRAGFLTDYMRWGKGRLVSVGHNPSCNVMYRRDIFLKESGFLDGLWPGEDVEFDHRLRRKGKEIVFNPRAVIFHYRPSNLKLFSRMMFRYGRAQGRLLRRHGILRKIQILPLLSLVIVFCVILSFFSVTIKGIFGFNIFIVFISLLALISWNVGFYKGIVSL